MAVLDIYTRISRDQEGAGLGVRRQEKDCRTHLDQLGHQAGEVLVDNDLSGYARKPRPAYRRLLERVATGASDGFVVWHLDRLTRHPTELEDVIETVEHAGALVLTVTGGAYDLATTDGRAMARVVGAFARKESEDKARRTKRKHLELAEAGRPVGGTRHFGYDPLKIDGLPVLLDDDGHPTLRVRPDEADQIRDAIARILAGESMRSVTRAWNDHGITCTRGGRMTASAVKRILTSPTLAGWRALEGQPIARGTWEPIIDQDTHQRIRAVIDARRGTRGTPRTYLLTGMIRCSRCQRGLVSQLRYQVSGPRRSYVCSPDPSKPSCGGVRIVAEETEAEVFDRLLSVLDARHAPPVDTPDTTPLLADLDRYETDLARLATDYYADRVIDRAQFFAASQALQARITDGRAKVAESVAAEAAQPAIDNLDGLPAEWEGWEIGRRRALLDRFVDHVTITPARHSRGKFDPERIDVTWRI